MNTDPSVTLKRKQWLIASCTVGGAILLLVFGMWLSDPNRKHSASMEAIRAAKTDSLKDYTVQSSGVVSAEEAWIEISEKRIKQLETTNADLNIRLERMLTLIESGGLKNQPISSGVSLPVPSDSAEQLNTDIAASQETLDVADRLLSAANTEPSAQADGSKLPPPPSPSKNSTQNPGNGSESMTPVRYPINQASTFPVSGFDQAGQGSKAAVSAPRPIVNNNTTVDGRISPATQGQGQGVNNDSSIMVVSLSTIETEKEKVPNVDSWLSAGSFATAVLMSGMDAPTGGASETSPLPVLLRIKDDGQLPNFFRSNISDCHMIGAGYGDIASERAKIRLETLSCVLKNGDIREVAVNGYITGEDGKEGMRGRLVERTGSLLAKTLLSGGLAGIGSSLGQQFNQVSTNPLGSVTTIDPNKVAQAGVAQGSQNALEKLADYYLKRANEIYPIIEVEANRIGEIVLTSKVDLGDTILKNTRKYAQ